MQLGFANALAGIAGAINKADEINRQRYLQDQELLLRQGADERKQQAHEANMTNIKRAWDVQDAALWADGQELYKDVMSGPMDKPFDFAVKHPAEIAAAQQAAPAQAAVPGATPSPAGLPTVAAAPAGVGPRSGAGGGSGKDAASTLRTGKSNSLFGSQGLLEEANSARESFNKELTKYEGLFQAADTPEKRRALNARFEKRLADLANTARTKKVEADATRVMELSGEALNEILAGNMQAANPILETLWGPEMVKMFQGAKAIGKNRVKLASGTVLDPASINALVNKTAKFEDQQKALTNLGNQLSNEYAASMQISAVSQRQLDPVEKFYIEDQERLTNPKGNGLTPKEADDLRAVGINLRPGVPLTADMAKKVALQWRAYNRHTGGKGTSGFVKTEIEQGRLDAKRDDQSLRAAFQAVKNFNDLGKNPMTMAQTNDPRLQAEYNNARRVIQAAMSGGVLSLGEMLEASLYGVQPAPTAPQNRPAPGARLNAGPDGRPRLITPGTGLPM